MTREERLAALAIDVQETVALIAAETNLATAAQVLRDMADAIERDLALAAGGC